MVRVQKCVSCWKFLTSGIDWCKVQGWLDIYRRYISLIYIGYMSDIFDIFNFYRVFKNIFNVTHCDYVLIFSLCVLLVYDLCRQHFLSVGQLLSDFTSPQQCSVNDKSTSPNLQSTHTHILLFGSKFHIILAMYVQMLCSIYRSH